MRRGCAWTIGVIVVIVLAIGLFGKSSPPVSQTDSQTQAAGPAKTTSHIDQLREAAGPELTRGISAKQYEAAAALIRLHGYDCPRADLMIRYIFSEGYDVYCRDGRYKFEIENHGGQWSVKAP
jgi:hypothetical protein